MPESSPFPLTRAAAHARLATFLPHAGEAYARRRNVDFGPGRHDSVSRLSAALRRRVITEHEVVGAARARHGAAADSFVSEVFWRTYWKGWLEQRPQVWRDALAGAARDRAALAVDHGLREHHAAAIAGQSGIDCFDHWAHELITTGYLHNWARMQFASIWVFTLRLPWRLGAAFMLDHLIDGDPASNTLSWRWVAGLHTPGKCYLADAGRIARMTDGRFAPPGLAQTAQPPEPQQNTDPVPLPVPHAPDPARPAVLLLTPEDLCPETLPLPAGLPITTILAPRALFPTQADRTAGADALARAQAHWDCPARWIDDTGDLGGTAGAAQIVTAHVPVGPTADALAQWQSHRDQPLAQIRRAWDTAAWPHCRKGYFQLKSRIPELETTRG